MYKIIPYESARIPLLRTSSTRIIQKVFHLTLMWEMKLKTKTGRTKRRSKRAKLLEMHFLPLCIYKHDVRIAFRAEERTTELQWREWRDLRLSQTWCWRTDSSGMYCCDVAHSLQILESAYPTKRCNIPEALHLLTHSGYR